MKDQLIGIISLIRGISDENIFAVNEELTFESSRLNIRITVIPGFLTDGASAPKFVWPFIDPWNGKYLAAAIIHDCLYSTKILTKEDSDLIFLDIMEYCGVNKITAKLIYNSVKYFGQKNWDAVKLEDLEFNRLFIRVKKND